MCASAWEVTTATRRSDARLQCRVTAKDADEGSGTCRHKAQLDDRHTDDGGRAAAQNKHQKQGMATMSMARFFPHGTTTGNQGGKGMTCSPDAPSCGGGPR
jgi:hypothetical protein